MHSQTLISALASALLLTTTTLALPSRTHCRCSITSVNTTSPSPSSSPYHDSLASPDTIDPDAPRMDLCAALGPSLESMRHSNPSLYESYVTESDVREAASATEEQRPLSTTVLLRLAAVQGFQYLSFSGDVREREEERRERIECRTEQSEVEVWSAYQVSWMTLVVLQIVVALVVVACVAEGVMLGMRWMTNCAGSAPATLPTRPSVLRLDGEEKRLLAVSPPEREDMRSPGVEKKLRAYAEIAAHLKDEDDDCNRAVM